MDFARNVTKKKSDIKSDPEKRYRKRIDKKYRNTI
jgi:hypothetical protein